MTTTTDPSSEPEPPPEPVLSGNPVVPSSSKPRYTEAFRNDILKQVCNEYGGVIGERLEALRERTLALNADADFPVRDTVQRWARKKREAGHFEEKPAALPQPQPQPMPVVQFSYADPSYVYLQGSELDRLVEWKRLKPNCSIQETTDYMRHFVPRVSPYLIMEAELRTGISRGVIPVVARAASLPEALAKRRDFWKMPYPSGIKDISTEDLLEIGEATVHVNASASPGTKVLMNRWCNEMPATPLLRGQWEARYMLTLCFSANGARHDIIGFQLAPLEKADGCMSVLRYVLENHPPGTEDRRVFLADFSSNERCRVMRQAVEEKGHRIVFRPGLWPEDAPMTFLLKYLESQLPRYNYNVNSMERMSNLLFEILRSTSSICCDCFIKSKYLVGMHT